MYKTISSEVKKILLNNQTCDLPSIHKQTWLPAVLKTPWHKYCSCRYCSTFEIHGDWLLPVFVYLLIDEQRNVLYVEFESAEKYTHLLPNTCSLLMDNSTRQLHINYGYISLSVVKCTLYS